MKKIYDDLKARLRQNWRNVMDSTQKKMNRGALFISRIFTKPHKDAWRRTDEKKPKQNKND